MTKPIQKNINGILLVNKGLGMSSNGPAAAREAFVRCQKKQGTRVV